MIYRGLDQIITSEEVRVVRSKRLAMTAVLPQPSLVLGLG